jgi:adenylosuccinate synthase
VIDLGFGDSGKGITVDWLCSRSLDPGRTLVVRFAGGHQVGHTVVIGGFRHTFSNFGAGTLRGVPTWYSPDTTIFPPAIIEERRQLGAYTPRLLLHPQAMVATPYDIAWNRIEERRRRHGSCGVGYGATVQRNRHGVKLAVKDLANPFILAGKLAGVRQYYEDRLRLEGDEALWADWRNEWTANDDGAFIESCDESRLYFRLVSLLDLRADYDCLVFEGNQGILLDAEEGIFPHVSWSCSTSERALSLLATLGRDSSDAPEIFYVTRCYQTRHGKGPMSGKLPVRLAHAELESNVDNPWQGPLRTAELDLDLLDWALATDLAHQESFTLSTGKSPKRHLVITCLDQRPDFDVQGLVARFSGRFGSIWGSFSPDSKDIRRLV